MNTPVPSLDTDRLTGLVFELSSQLHAERLHRIALEYALVQAGVLEQASLERVASDPALRELGRRAVEESVAKLMHVLTERDELRKGG